MNFKCLKYVFLILYLSCFFAAFPQNANEKAKFIKNETAFRSCVTDEKRDSALYYLQQCEKMMIAHPESEEMKHFVYFLKAQYYSMMENNVDLRKNCIPAYHYFKKTNRQQNELEAALYMANSYFMSSFYDSTIYYCNAYIPLAIKLKDNKTLTVFYLLKGRCLAGRAQLNDGADVLRQALDFSKKQKSNKNIFASLLALAGIYQEINSAFCLNYLNQAKFYLKDVGNGSKNTLYTCFGNTYRNLGKYDSALYFYNKNLELINKNNDKTHYGAMIGNIGNVYSDMGRLDEALDKQFESLEYFKMASDSLDIEIAYGTIADIYLKKENYKEALNYYYKATSMSLRLGFIEELIYNYTGLYQCYEKIGDYKEAYKAYKLYHLYNDSIRNVETTKKLTEQEMNYRFENQKKEQQIIQNAKDELTAVQIKNQKLTIYAGFGGGLILIIFLIVSVRNSTIRKKINQQLELSHTEINKQKNIIETKNREITDSILYASRIQQGILPDSTDIKKMLPTSFLFYRPRDIVSGDFYWIKQLKGSSQLGFDDLVGVVVADCTGHGVPGAFMSFIGSTILNQTLGHEKIETPADALNYLNMQLPLTLQSKVKTGQINDGMEAGILTINKSTNKLFFAGANLNLIHIRKNVVTEIKGNKHSIGLNIEQQKTFTNNEMVLEKGDCVYMFSDGYPDQFGGPKGKKYKYKNLLAFLNANSVLSADEQYKLISENFDNWKGSLEQLDDVLLFGMKV